MTLVEPLLAACLAAAAVLVWPGGTVAVPHTGQAPVPPLRSRRAGRAVAAGRHGAAGGRASTPAGCSGHLPLRQIRPLLGLLTGGSGLGGSTHPGEVTEEVQLLDGLAAALEAGLPTEHAVRVALAPVASGPRAGTWSELARAAAAGQPLGPAWQRLARRTGSPTAASVARAWTVAGATGAPVAAAVRASAHAARERRRLERTVEVATAGARATATVLGLLPLAGVGLAALVGVGPSALYSQPLALASAGLGIVLLLLGHLVVRRMVGRVLRGVS